MNQRSVDTGSGPGWVFLSNHGNVLLCIVRDPTVRISEVADLVGIGERAAQKIIADLAAEGYITRTRQGRRNHYTVNRQARMRHSLFGDIQIGRFVDALGDGRTPD
jgi:predicted ArsR family transcriptional regulator